MSQFASLVPQLLIIKSGAVVQWQESSAGGVWIKRANLLCDSSLCAIRPNHKHIWCETSKPPKYELTLQFNLAVIPLKSHFLSYSTAFFFSCGLQGTNTKKTLVSIVLQIQGEFLANLSHFLKNKKWFDVANSSPASPVWATVRTLSGSTFIKNLATDWIQLQHLGKLVKQQKPLTHIFLQFWYLCSANEESRSACILMRQMFLRCCLPTITVKIQSSSWFSSAEILCTVW